MTALAERPVAPSPSAPPRPDDHGASLQYEPALDGIRGIALVAVLFFHAQFAWAIGGFLAVSTFFTLSGFLITSLLLRERAGRGRISLNRFWARRLRRLMPAALLTLGLVVVMGAVGIWTPDQMRSLRPDVIASLGYVANWRFIAADRSYAAIFAAPSPVQHFWSLAIEEQFYMVFPLLAAGLLAVGRGTRRWFAGVLVALIAGSIALSWVLYNPLNTAPDYYGTGTRAAELLIGAVLALVVSGRFVIRNLLARWTIIAAGSVGLAATIWFWHTVAQDTSWLYRGGFAVYAVGSAALVLGALQPGPLRWLLALAPLRGLGRISYGAYLYHWPVFLWLSPRRTGLSPWPLFGLRIAVMLALALTSYLLIEQPVRTRRRIVGRTPLVAVPAAVVTLVVALVAVTWSPPPLTVTLAGSGRSKLGTKAAVAPTPTRILLVGDAVASSLVEELSAWRHGRLDIRDATRPDCGLARGGEVHAAGFAAEPSTSCDEQSAAWPGLLTESRPDAVVVLGGLWEVSDRRIDRPGEQARTPGDPEFDAWLQAEPGPVADTLGTDGTTIVWMTAPHFARRAPDGSTPPPGVWSEHDPARIDRFNAAVRTVASSRPNMTVVDLAAFTPTLPGGELGPDTRADGVAFSKDAADEIAGWLGPQLVEFRRKPAEVAPPTQLEALGSAPPPGPGPQVPPLTVRPDEDVRVMVLGDSVAYGLAYGLERWSNANGGMEIFNGGQFGCPVARGGRIRFLRNVEAFPEYCDWSATFPQWVSDIRPHVVALMTGVWETADRILPGTTQWTHLGEPDYDEYYERELLLAVDTIGAEGARVALVTYPYVEAGAPEGMTGLPESEHARMDRLNEILGRVAALRPAFVTVLDLQGWMRAQPGGELDPAKRTDGIHIRDEYTPVIAEWMCPELDALAFR